MKRYYRKIKLPDNSIQYQVVTSVGFHWRHVAVVTVTNGKANKAERYFYSTRVPEIILPFEVMGSKFIVGAIKTARSFCDVPPVL